MLVCARQRLIVYLIGNWNENRRIDNRASAAVVCEEVRASHLEFFVLIYVSLVNCWHINCATAHSEHYKWFALVHTIN